MLVKGAAVSQYIRKYVGNRHQSKRFGGSSLTQANAMPVAAFILYRTFCLLLSIGKDASKITCICCRFITCF